MKPVVICLSGKRRCGKDFVANLLERRLSEFGYAVVVCGISYPLKEEYAELMGVDATRLKYDLLYKEKYRQQMVDWSEKIRNEDSSYFCRKVLANLGQADVLIVPDCRRLSDINFFKTHCDTRLRQIRIESTLSVRKKRGFEFVAGIDDQATECDLDGYDKWDIVIPNDIQIEDGDLPPQLNEILTLVCHEVRILLNVEC